MSVIVREDGTISKNQKEILSSQAKFYETL